ncbi:unnamed protein product [Fusarium graminearum]|uniref:Chromosome 2, complete genome n=1 Tax=Gibberella zeae (strain ATCC MYA-4620 / CBS 123657 / FGSC 9075 / NRRL 31084 / PH-1) TaxID=229533 RepID=I1S672_GIBZE|nr:hypothetical protein FGSG_12343 [Fusarium graminearum PH-1]ESU09209.1 hypothetical protein FGSG_12343 [Fusarium graminearum PH-1]CEF78862.1 unnamed protein product [Fusarium graminearum]CZS82155.1 unnamed protein product [Fusarium graminearum]|eukprot:XP_011321708.1 hypothetical protein FGSG_12343 [Fusarium graminearum PH-1]
MDEPKKPGRPSSFNEPPIWSRSKANLAKPSCLSSNPHVFRSIGIHAVAKDNGLRHKMRGNLNPALELTCRALNMGSRHTKEEPSGNPPRNITRSRYRQYQPSQRLTVNLRG